MAQFLQQIPCMPMAQGFMVTARSKTVSMPKLWACRIISWVATSMDAPMGSAFFSALAVFSSAAFFSMVVGRSSYELSR